MHRLVTEHPALVEIEELRAEAKAKAETDEKKVTAEWDDYRAAAAHAARNGAPMPTAPGRNPGAVWEEQRERDATLRRLHDEAFVEHAEEMRELLLAREQELLDEAGPLAERLWAICDEVGLLITTTNRVVRNQRGPGLHSPVEGLYSLTSVDPIGLSRAIDHGWRFLTEPVAPPSVRSAAKRGDAA